MPPAEPPLSTTRDARAKLVCCIACTKVASRICSPRKNKPDTVPLTLPANEVPSQYGMYKREKLWKTGLVLTSDASIPSSKLRFEAHERLEPNEVCDRDRQSEIVPSCVG